MASSSARVPFSPVDSLEQAPGQKPTVLVVDDTVEVIDLLVDLLQGPYRVKAAWTVQPQP